MEIKNGSISYSEAKSLFHCDTEEGILFWKKQLSPRCGPWTQAGNVASTGYVRVSISKKCYSVHRIVWLLHYKKWPELPLDHINGNRADNRISNLRMADRSTNAQNEHGVRKNNTSGFKGVISVGGKWHAQISLNRKCIRLGSYDTPEEAHSAYLNAKSTMHPGWAGVAVSDSMPM